MIDLSNLYHNMTEVCEHAALHELEIMLRVLRNRLEKLHPQVGVKLTEGLELLDEEIHRKLRARPATRPEHDAEGRCLHPPHTREE